MWWTKNLPGYGLESFVVVFVCFHNNVKSTSEDARVKKTEESGIKSSDWGQSELTVLLYVWGSHCALK